MNKIKVYLAGGMAGLSFEESNEWRKEVEGSFMFKMHSSVKDTIKCINPNDYYNFFKEKHNSETEIRDFDLHKVRTCDFVIVNFNAPNSIGTAQELAVAKELNIPIIGVIPEGATIHPWLEICCMRICKTLDDAVDYAVEYLMN